MLKDKLYTVTAHNARRMRYFSIYNALDYAARLDQQGYTNILIDGVSWREW